MLLKPNSQCQIDDMGVHLTRCDSSLFGVGGGEVVKDLSLLSPSLGGKVRRGYLMPITLVPPDPPSPCLLGRGKGGPWGDPRQEGDAPFEFLTYQLDGKNEAYHGYNG
jgi:hypothetical protein